MMNTMSMFIMLGGGFYLAINILFILWWSFVNLTRSKMPAAIQQKEHARQNFKMIPQTTE